MRRRLAPALAVALAVSIAGGCGGDDEQDTATPASVAPADSLLYMDAVLRPEGEERTAIEAPLAALLGTDDPGASIIEVLDGELAEDGATYAEDIEPWLGDRGGIFFTEVPAFDDAAGAFIVETTDPDAALAFAEKFADDGDAFEIVDGHLVGGSEEGVQAAVEAAEGDSLEDDAEFDSLLGAETAATGRLFADLPGILDEAEAKGEVGGDVRETLDSVLGGFLSEPLTAVLEGETTGIGLEVSSGSLATPLFPAGEESALLRELPEDTWLAAALPEVGEFLASYLDTAAGLGITELEAVEAGIREQFGLDPSEAFGRLGEGVLFGNGSGIFSTGGGLVFETDSPEAGRELIAALERGARRAGQDVRPLSGRGGEEGFAVSVDGVPGAINFVATDERIVIAYGDTATASVLEPGDGDGVITDSEGFIEAQGALGEDYAATAYFDFGPLVQILDLASAAEPSLQRVVPYLESLDYVVAGSAADGERERHRIHLGVADITTEPTT